ncbi:ATP phosphoribosyltransferase regulatory subunit [Magnetospirillum fulvum]|uniref:ATP phosphoribosyltransferase regulatory subunit n=1 Tax=Magnetospirillum fulvum TaxID=1082 RepID=A0A1H6HHY6_MAGFU|nr:ATP phosphoribosyltransferase regulatory subunit [Magnetospirillum fulvum]SEH33710.1 ATP phosphoribosyltransferase regulatory subunit [Magnetospirillum fulvum]
MTDFAHRALLPAGLRDMLSPDAAHEAGVVERLMRLFAAQGYDRVKPPLIEFEESLLDGPAAAAAAQTFRVMDPQSQKIMGLRADMTPQVARIATTRLAGAPRPLRLSYAGQVLRVKGSQLRADRQFAQAGIELIGSDAAAADAEVLVLIGSALAELGVEGVTVDLSLPTLVPALFAELGLEGEVADSLRAALDHKDSATVAEIGGAAAGLLQSLIAAAGPADRALAALQALALPPAAAAERERLAGFVARVRAALPDLPLTVDPVENRGFEYHSGVGFTLYARNLGAELGRGGRYLAGGIEPAVGATLFMDSVLATLPAPRAPGRVFVPAGTARARIRDLHDQGWVTVAGLDDGADAAAEAHRLGCGHRLGPDGLIDVL